MFSLEEPSFPILSTVVEMFRAEQWVDVKGVYRHPVIKRPYCPMSVFHGLFRSLFRSVLVITA